ncbi:multiple epidermal growth factor-like domains protein 10 [Haliotis cracherodii]|uniref:multiple epidermal growth factor-like domains protein 10 n=1 Tax=Haliotis cracherodii TaxID=6455 RepID=UPI0039E8C81A
MPSRNAVDGETSARNYRKCFHSAASGVKSAWWRVDLREMTQIHDVTIYFRADYTIRRNGIQIYIAETDASPPAGDLCYNVTGKEDGTDILDILNVTCSGEGRYLVLYRTVKNNKDKVPIMDFCEVQVYVCGPGTFGSDCANYCHCDGDVCDYVSGICPSGDCLPGWQQDKCDTECIPGDFGPKCSQKCSERNCKNDNSSCDHVTGECAEGCMTGWNGKDCTQKCLLTYGDDCANLCSDRQCRETSTCDHVTGKCESGCKPGWKETDCSIECIQDKEYGSSCVGNCSARMCDGGTGSCPRKTGQCGSVCLSGWQGEDCAQKCTLGKYGPNCNQKCYNRNCEDDNSSCDHVTGECVGGCMTGWNGTDCTQKCLHTYGDGCAYLCSARHCSETSTCDHVTGKCENGCNPGWKDTDCTTECKPGTFGPDCSRCGYCDVTCNVGDGHCPGKCLDGFTGDRCDVDVRVSPVTSGVIGGAVGVAVMLLLIAGLLGTGRLTWRSSACADPKDGRNKTVTGDTGEIPAHAHVSDVDGQDYVELNDLTREGDKMSTYDVIQN